MTTEPPFIHCARSVSQTYITHQFAYPDGTSFFCDLFQDAYSAEWPTNFPAYTAMLSLVEAGLLVPHGIQGRVRMGRGFGQEYSSLAALLKQLKEAEEHKIRLVRIEQHNVTVDWGGSKHAPTKSFGLTAKRPFAQEPLRQVVHLTAPLSVLASLDQLLSTLEQS